jgi:hypothetical protein
MLVDIAARKNGVDDHLFPFDPEQNSKAADSAWMRCPI